MSRTLRRIWNRLLGSLSRRNPDADLAEEFDSHIRLLAEENIRRSLPPEEAYRLFAGWIVQLLVSTTTLNIPRLDEVRVDFGVLVFAFGLTLLTGLVFGVLPAWRFTRSEALRAGSHTVTVGLAGPFYAEGVNREKFFDRLLANVNAIPGVQSSLLPRSW